MIGIQSVIAVGKSPVDCAVLVGSIYINVTNCVHLSTWKNFVDDPFLL